MLVFLTALCLESIRDILGHDMGRGEILHWYFFLEDSVRSKDSMLQTNSSTKT